MNKIIDFDWYHHIDKKEKRDSSIPDYSSRIGIHFGAGIGYSEGLYGNSFGFGKYGSHGSSDGTGYGWIALFGESSIDGKGWGDKDASNNIDR